MAVAMQIEGKEPRQAVKEALTDGIAEFLSYDEAEPPEAFRFRVEKFRRRREAGDDFGTELAGDIMDMQGTPPDDLVEQIAEDTGIDRRFAERQADAHTRRIADSYRRHVETAPARARKLLESYSDLDVPVDIILGIQKGQPLDINSYMDHRT